MFRDKVLKIFDLNDERDRGDAESENEVIMMNWLSGKLPVPKLLANEVENGKRFLLMSRVGGEMDFCLPNLFFENGRLSGFIDLGKTGIADKWCDIAICYRSLCNNFAGVYDGKMYDGFSSEMFFKKLGVEPNWEKIRYYILLDELF